MDNLSLASLQAAIGKVVGRSRLDFSDLSAEQLTQVCSNLGFKMSPYLVVEAHLHSCGGHQAQGKGPFDIEKLLEWLRKREVKIVVKPSHSSQLSPVRGNDYESSKNPSNRRYLPSLTSNFQKKAHSRLANSIDVTSGQHRLKGTLLQGGHQKSPSFVTNEANNASLNRMQRVPLPSVNSPLGQEEHHHYNEKVNNVMFGDVVQAMRQNKTTGLNYRDSIGKSLHDKDIEKLVRDDLAVNFRMSGSDWNATEQQKRTKFELKMKENLQMAKKSTKLNKLIFESFHKIQAEYEEGSAQVGAFAQDRARQRLRSDKYKSNFEKPELLKHLYMNETSATDASRLEKILESKWYDDKKNYRMISRISPKASDRINRLLYNRDYF